MVRYAEVIDQRLATSWLATSAQLGTWFLKNIVHDP
jgi:hypothetical protein